MKPIFGIILLSMVVAFETVQSDRHTERCDCDADCALHAMSPLGCLQCCASSNLQQASNGNNDQRESMAFSPEVIFSDSFARTVRNDAHCECHPGCFYPVLQECARCCATESRHQQPHFVNQPVYRHATEQEAFHPIRGIMRRVNRHIPTDVLLSMQQPSDEERMADNPTLFRTWFK